MALELQPRLVVRGAARALEFYRKVFGAVETERFADESRGGHIVHAGLTIGDVVLSLTEEDRESHNDAPPSLGGTPVLLSLQVEDARAVGAALERAGAKVIFPIKDQFYGRREGRFVDPFGHMWIISQHLEELTQQEIQRRMDATGGG